MKLGLVLSGGGARCFAQIGVLKALEEANLYLSALAGSSTGAVLAALYAAGKSADELYDLAKHLDYKSLIGSSAPGGVSDESDLRDWLEQHLPKTFEDLNVPVAITTTDIQNGRLHIYSQGELITPLCGAHAFPGLFAPVKWGDLELMDGGILNNFPVDIIRPFCKDSVMGVNCSPSPKEKVDTDKAMGLAGFARALFGPLTGQHDILPPAIQLLEKSYTITQSRLIDVLTTLHPPDHKLVPDLPDEITISAFDKLGEAYEIGYACAKTYLAEHLHHD